MGGDVGPDQLTDVGQRTAVRLVLAGDVVAGGVRRPHSLALDAPGELLGGLGHMGVGAEEDVDLPTVGESLGVGDLLLIGGGLVLLAELGMDNDKVGARRAGRLGCLRNGADVVERHRVSGGIIEAVEPHGRGDLGHGHCAPLALELIEREGCGGVLPAPVGARVPQPMSIQGVQGGDDSRLPPVRGVIGCGRAAVPPRSRQGSDDLGGGAEGREARVDPVWCDGNLHPAQGQIQALDPRRLGGDVVGDVPRSPWSGTQNRHVHEDVPGVTHGEAHVLRAVGSGGGRCAGGGRVPSLLLVGAARPGGAGPTRL